MTHTCRHKDLVQLWSDGELTGEKKRFMDDHLETCGICRAEQASTKQLSSLLGELDEIDLSPGFDRAFWKKVDEYEGQRHSALFGGRISGGWRMVFAPLLVILILATGIITFKKPFSRPLSLTYEEIALVDHMEFLNDFDVIDNLDLIEDMDVLSQMKEAS